jgi:hypothetical protein
MFYSSLGYVGASLDGKMEEITSRQMPGKTFLY